MNQDPVSTVLQLLQNALKQSPLGDTDALRDDLERRLSDLFRQFQLVPKRDIEQQQQALKRLEQVVGDLEARIRALETQSA